MGRSAHERTPTEYIVYLEQQMQQMQSVIDILENNLNALELTVEDLERQIQGTINLADSIR